MSEMTPAKATALRKPFPKESVGQLPKGGVMLDFVGHAAVTDRLLTVDPEWSWDFAETDPATGKPSLRYSLDPDGNLWIRLTICGITRLGVGDGKNAKERIGDALRNAAMRFGVALDLWAKENLVEFAQAAGVAPADPKPVERKAERVSTTPDDDPWQNPPPEGSPLLDTTSNLAKSMYAAINKAGIPEEERIEQVSLIIGRPITSTKQMTDSEARLVLDHLKKQGAPA